MPDKEKQTRKPRETKEKSPERLAADAFDKIRVLKQTKQEVMDVAAAKHEAKIVAVFNDLSAEAQVAFNKMK